jgi:hypothetical protein
MIFWLTSPDLLFGRRFIHSPWPPCFCLWVYPITLPGVITGNRSLRGYTGGSFRFPYDLNWARFVSAVLHPVLPSLFSRFRKFQRRERAPRVFHYFPPLFFPGRGFFYTCPAAYLWVFD